jgi:hypothetical protein
MVATTIADDLICDRTRMGIDGGEGDTDDGDHTACARKRDVSPSIGDLPAG